MFLFDWSKVYKASKGNPVEVQRILRMLVHKQIPETRYDAIYKYSHTSFAGDSFLLYPHALLEQAHKYTYKEVADYLAAASFRLLASYKLNKIRTLDRVLLPFQSEEQVNSFIKNNRLLELRENKIFFKYEEVH